jgi:hypothetical protein
MTVATTPDELAAAVKALPPGSVVHYHVGFLLRDRATSPASKASGVAAMALYEAGKIDLLQRRLEPDRYEYLAIVRRPAPASRPRPGLRKRNGREKGR